MPSMELSLARLPICGIGHANARAMPWAGGLEKLRASQNGMPRSLPPGGERSDRFPRCDEPNLMNALGIKSLEMRGVIDTANLDVHAGNVDLVDAAGVLREPPIGGQGHICQLHKQRPVDAVMGDQHHGLIGMPFERET